MSDREDELRLERHLRELLRDRDPGPVPYGLRQRVDRVPAEAPGAGVGLRSGITRILGLAAVVALLVGGIQVLGVPRATGPGAGPSESPLSTFDPTLEGPGIIRTSAEGAAVPLGLFATFALVAGIGLTRRRPLRLALGAAAVALPVAAGVLAFVPGPVQGGLSGAGPGTEWAEMPAGYEGDGLMYVRVGPEEPYGFGFSIRNDGPLPIRLEGIVEEDRSGTSLPFLTALWVDGEPDHGSTGPAMPFTARDLAPGDDVVLWLVARASPCAVGPAWNPRTDADTGGYPRSTLLVRYSVLGWPRTADMALRYQVYEPIVVPCPASARP